MQPVQRVGHADRMIVRNSKVYASTLAVPHIKGLFAYRDIDEGEILAQYTGPILTQKQANESKSEYLFDLWYRSREGAETVVKKTLDGEGQLAGFANHAPESLANAKSVDLLPKIIDHDIFYEGRHALVLVAKAFIPKGIEIRFNYNADQKNGRYAFCAQCPWEGKNGKTLKAFKFCSKRDYETFVAGSKAEHIEEAESEHIEEAESEHIEEA